TILCSHTVSVLLAVSFFFQAEDGIRGFHVTGVQTCALPIYVKVPVDHRLGEENKGFTQVMQGFDFSRALIGLQCIAVARESLKEIGRASCRERVEVEEAGGGGGRGK